MAVLTEGKHEGEFLLSEANGRLSRDIVTVVVPAATTLPAGAVLALGQEGYAPIGEALGASDILGILYGPLVNEDDESALMSGAVINAIAEVRGADLDWNDQAADVQLVAIAVLRSQGVKVRDYTPLGS